jgi:hypothetical protein
MSIFHLTNPNEQVKRDIFCNSCNCESIKVFDTLEVKDFFFDAKNGDKVELSNIADKGNVGQVLKSDGAGGIIWGSDLTGGVEYNGVLPTVDGQLSLYSGIDGSTIKNSLLVEQDLLDTQSKANTNETNITTLQGDVGTLQTDVGNLQNDKLDKNGSIAMTGNFNVNNNNILNVNNLQTQEIKSTDGVSINIQDDINLGLYNLENGNEMKINTISANTVPNIVSNNNLDLNNNDLLDISSMTITSTQYISKLADLPTPT